VRYNAISNAISNLIDAAERLAATDIVLDALEVAERITKDFTRKGEISKNDVKNMGVSKCVC
jgi:hypothetical protein